MNGYKIQQKIRETKTLISVMAGRFTDNVVQFDDEEKVDLESAYADYLAAEDRLARLQMLQTRYNLRVMVTASGAEMTLHEACKRVGGVGRGEKMWRSQLSTGKKDRWEASRDAQRNKDTIYAKPAVTQAQCLKHAQAAGRAASALREAIQAGNATEINDLEFDAGLFE